VVIILYNNHIITKQQPEHNMKAFYTHDCDQCNLISIAVMDGREMDLYYCTATDDLVARYSSDGPDYSSAPINYVKIDGKSPLSLAKKLHFR
jgi:hypothetical protein